MQTNAARNRARGAISTTAWLILAVLLLFSIAAPLNQFKVPPIMPILMQALNLSVSGAGMLMSVFAITGLILALPSGFILQRTGFRTTGIIAGGSMVLGAALGALSQSNSMLLLSRVIEGVGTGFMAVLAPALIAQWFAAEKRGTAMGIWSAWVPMGTGVMLIIAPRLAQSAGWPAVWWLGAAYAAVVTLVYLLVVRPAPAMAEPASVAASHAARPMPASPLRNRNIWLLAGAFGAFGAAGVGLNTYMPTYLATVRGVPLGQAALLAGIPTLVTIISAPGGGIVSDRVRSRKKPYLVGFALTIVLLPLTGVVSVSALVVLQVIIGLALGLIPTNVFSAAVEAAGDERLGGLAMAVIMVGQNAGMLVGPIIFGALAEGPGWPAAFASLAVMSAVGLLCGWLARVR
jgi:MFS family permease